jgi:hypothetical protein
VAFIVQDLEEARSEVEAAGIEIVGATVWAEEAFSNPNYAGTGWFFVRGPDSNMYVFQQVRDEKPSRLFCAARLTGHSGTWPRRMSYDWVAPDICRGHL